LSRRFCKKHSSHFCPCVASWLYTPRERAAYERGRWHGERVAVESPPPVRRKAAQLRLR
jgi:hypothetical protein